MSTGRVGIRLSRDLILLLLGISGIVHETVLQSGERPTLLILFAACIGFPVFLRTDESQAAKVLAATALKEETEEVVQDGPS